MNRLLSWAMSHRVGIGIIRSGRDMLDKATNSLREIRGGRLRLDVREIQ
jgi:GTP cyclohydrolase III